MPLALRAPRANISLCGDIWNLRCQLVFQFQINPPVFLLTIAVNFFFFKKLSGEQPKIVPWNRSLSPRHFHCLEIIRCKTSEFRLCLSEHFVYLRFSSGVEPKNAGFRSELCLWSAIPESSPISIAVATSTSIFRRFLALELLSVADSMCKRILVVAPKSNHPQSLL